MDARYARKRRKNDCPYLDGGFDVDHTASMGLSDLSKLQVETPQEDQHLGFPALGT